MGMSLLQWNVVVAGHDVVVVGNVVVAGHDVVAAVECRSCMGMS